MSVTASDIKVQDLADEFAKSVHRIARNSDNEEELRINMQAAINDLAADLEMEPDPENERTVFSGRPDAVYGDLVIEYKDPNHSGDWANEAFNGRNVNDNGLADYMYDLAVQQSYDEAEVEAVLDRMIGVGTNGFEIFFCRYKPDVSVSSDESSSTTADSELTRDQAIEGVEILEKHSINDGSRAFLTYLRSLSRKRLTSTKLAESFGPDGDIARETVEELYSTLIDANETNPRVSTLYDEWNRVFGVVYGEDLDQVRDDRELFGSIYGLRNPEVRPLLFSVHTYYAILMKMLVTELLATSRNTPIEEAGLHEPDNDALKTKLDAMEKGTQFELSGLEDFFEEGFFSWYLDTWNEDTASQVRSIADELLRFEPATSTIKPEAVRDILKDLYQELVPEVVRHDLGEYLTPDWLAEYIVEQVEYRGEGGILDPACGSGTFLVEAIRLVRENSNNEGEELLDEILEQVVGFDLNPVSVISSRTNYLLSLGDLAFETSSVRIPIYQCDSILTPSKYVDFSGGQGYAVNTQEGTFRIPELSDQSETEELLDLVQEYIEMGATSDEFIEVAGDQFEISGYAEDTTRELYEDIHRLESQNRDGVWTELLRNRIAPEFVDDFKHVVGNPPYVNWENLSQGYRDITEDLWSQYDLFESSGYNANITRDDIAVLMTYVAMDEYLAEDGQLSFVLPQSLLKSHRGGHGFRRFAISKPQSQIPVSVQAVDDLSLFNPFDASNNTAVITVKKNQETRYPVPYRIWQPNSTVYGTDSLEAVLEKIDTRNVVGEPVQENDIQSEWLTLKPEAITAVRKFSGSSDYTARVGAFTSGGDGAYHAELVEDRGDIELIKNLPHEGRQPAILDRGEIKHEFEKELIYPTVKGRHISRWDRSGALHLLLPHLNERGPHNAIPESDMRTSYPKAYQYFKEWDDILENTRERNSKFYDSDIDPFYLLDNVGEYTFKPYKAAWREISGGVQSVVLEPTDEGLGTAKPIANTHKVMFIPFSNRDAAYFACAIMNSSFTQLIIKGYTEALTGLSPHILETVDVPTYMGENDVHDEIVRLSKEAHETSDEARIREIEAEIDELVAQIYEVTDDELNQVQEALEEL